MRKFLLFAAVVPLLLMATPLAASVDNQFDAVCKVTAGGGSGSGCAFQGDSRYTLVLTAAHVVDGQANLACEFWSQGHQSTKIPAQLYALDKATDSACLIVPTAAFAGRVPKMIPLGTAADMPPVGGAIVSTGCAGGAWASTFRGHVLKYTDDGRFWFLPPPAGGRSGAAITNAAGDKIIGVLQVRSPDNTYGGATRIDLISAKIVQKTGMASSAWKPTAEIYAIAYASEIQTQQCGPGGCPAPRPQGKYIVPHLFGKEDAPSSGSPYPTLPPPTPLAPAPQTEVNTVDQDARSAAQSASLKADAIGQQVGQLGQQVGQIGQAVAANTEAIGKLGQVVAPLSRLRDKLEADAEAGGIKGKMAQRVLDVADGGTGGDDPLRKILITVGIVLGILFIGGIMVLHTMRTGNGPIHDVVAKLAEKNPDNERLAALHAKMDAVDAKIAGVGKAVEKGVGVTVGGAVGGVPGMVAGDALQQLKDWVEARLTPAPGQVPAATTQPGITVNAGGGTQAS
jgi:hypothetical protein